MPTPSTWPWTRCPPSRSPTRSERSRLTGEPGARSPSPVRCSVSAITSAVKSLPDRPVTVRQVPLTAMESPWPRVRGDLWSPHGDPGRTVEMLDGHDLAEFFHDSGEHPRFASSGPS